MEELLTQKELCEWLKITAMTAYRWRRKEGLPYVRIGNGIRYDKAQVMEWIRKNNK